MTQDKMIQFIVDLHKERQKLKAENTALKANLARIKNHVSPLAVGFDKRIALVDKLFGDPEIDAGQDTRQAWKEIKEFIKGW